MCPALQGYTFFVGLLYAMVGLLILMMGLSVWVAWCFKNRSFPAIWWVSIGLGLMPTAVHTTYWGLSEAACAAMPPTSGLLDHCL